MTTLSPSALLVAAAIAMAAGLVGSFALMRRMTLAADALSHVALPGIGVAILLRVHPFVGAVTALLVGALLIWRLESQTRLATEAIIGVVFSAALAIGALLTTGEQLLDALFGAPSQLASWEVAAGLAGAGLVIAIVRQVKDRMILAVLSRDIALTSGIAVRRLDLLYLATLSFTVALGLRYLGVLLMGSLLIIPPAAARLIARNVAQMLTLSATIAVLSMLTGAWLAFHARTETGPMIVIVAVALFVVLAIIAPSTRASRTPRGASG